MKRSGSFKLKKRFQKTLACLLAALLAGASFSALIFAEEAVPIDTQAGQFDCKSAILMEASTGAILFEQNAEEALPPASVTKVMTLLLVMEAIRDGKLGYDDMVTASAHACSMGGSQIYLEEGEQMTVEDMIKSVVIASANDAAVALAEHIAGTEEAFVNRMNERAAELSMANTHFENTNGLDDTVSNHVTSAKDIAIMSRELLRYEKITEYSSIWMDTIRNGEFGLTNTNRLVRFYNGATGLKTGSTAKAGFCVSATAERGGMELICVIMAAPSRDIRNAAATALLDWGFANYAICEQSGGQIEPIPVVGGVQSVCNASYEAFRTVLNKSDQNKIQSSVELPERLTAPVEKGQKIGEIVYTLNGQEIGRIPVTAEETIEEIGFWDVILGLLKTISLC